MSEPRLVPLSPQRHGGQAWRRFDTYAFARFQRLVPLVLPEAEPVAACLPILFRRIEAGAPPLPVALIRVRPGGASPFVSPAGLWLAAYVPAAMRLHPFAARATEDGRMMLLIDEASPCLVSPGEGAAPFFTPEGQPDASLAPVIDFFRSHEQARKATLAACAALEEVGLFLPAEGETESRAGLPEGSGEGLLLLDRARLDALEDAGWLALRRAGALSLAAAHFVSLQQLPWLVRAEEGRDAAPAAPALPPPAPPADGVSDFLAALATARQAEAADAGLALGTGSAADAPEEGPRARPASGGRALPPPPSEARWAGRCASIRRWPRAVRALPPPRPSLPPRPGAGSRRSPSALILARR